MVVQFVMLKNRIKDNKSVKPYNYLPDFAFVFPIIGFSFLFIFSIFLAVYFVKPRLGFLYKTLGSRHLFKLFCMISFV